MARPDRKSLRASLTRNSEDFAAIFTPNPPTEKPAGGILRGADCRNFLTPTRTLATKIYF